MPPEYNIRSVDRALAVLDCYDLEHTSFSIDELAKKNRIICKYNASSCNYFGKPKLSVPQSR